MLRRRDTSSINKLRVSEGLLNGLLWCAILLVPVLNAELTSRETLYFEELLNAWLKIVPYFIIFHVHNQFFAPRYLARKEHGKYIAVNLIFSAVIFTIVDHIQTHYIGTFNFFPTVNKGIYGNISFTDLTIFWNVVISICMTSASAGIKLIYKSMRDDQQMEILRRQNLQVEMDYLKYQINPHFFMNTLNNIHALIDIDSDTAKSAILELSKMMRYVLYESGHEAISLRQDIEFIRNYIELMRIRFEGVVDVNLCVSDQLPSGVKHPPLLFIVFVENAFKHGIGAGVGYYINIELSYSDGSLTCQVVNRIPRCLRRNKAGIGLVNVRKRLELLYGDKFTLVAEPRGEEYFVKLTIPVEI